MTSPPVLIDSDVAIDFLKGEEYSLPVLSQLLRARRAWISVLSIYEVYAGMRPGEEKATEAFVRCCRILFVDQGIARRAAGRYQRFRRRGITLTTVDCLLGATALHLRMRILSRNTKHYPEPGLLVDLAP